MRAHRTIRDRRTALAAALRSSSGSALVELALVGTMLATILLGAAEFAMLAYDSIEVSDAARAGAAYGSESTGTAGDSTGIKSVAAKSANDVSGLTTTPAVLTSCSSTPATHPASSCPSGDSVLTYIQVTTSATITMPIHIPGLNSYTLSGQAIMRVQ